MKILTDRKGFTLIELLVVIGILAVLAAIAIPSVAGLIDRANVSADNTNCNEMTSAIERFASEYELYCQDIASGVIKDADNNGVPDDMDSAQGRVFNVTHAIDRGDIELLEKPASAGTDTAGRAIFRDTKYPVNAETARAIVENYTKTSSSTFEPKQSDMHYWYSPDCGVIVFGEPESTVAQLNAQIQSGQDAKGNALSDSTKWIDITLDVIYNNDDNGVTPPEQQEPIVQKAVRNETTLKEYDTINEALVEVSTGDILKLYADVEDYEIMSTKGCIDINGHVLKSDYIVTRAVYDSKDGQGKIDAIEIRPTTKETDLLIYDNTASGWRVFKWELKNLGATAGNNEVYCKAGLYFTNPKAYELIKNSDYSINVHYQTTPQHNVGAIEKAEYLKYQDFATPEVTIRAHSNIENGDIFSYYFILKSETARLSYNTESKEITVTP